MIRLRHYLVSFVSSKITRVQREHQRQQNKTNESQELIKHNHLVNRIMIAKIFISLLLIEYGTQTVAFSSQRVFVSKPHRQNVKIVSDLMTQDPFTLSPSTPVDEALSDLLLVGVSGAPVVERLKTQDGKIELSLVGFVSSFDFLPREEDGLVMLGAMEDSETARRILGQNVGDIMSKNPVTITNNDLMKTAAEKMAKHR